MPGGRVAKEYRAYYAQRPAREAKEERDILREWEASDAEAWAILEREERSHTRSSSSLVPKSPQGRTSSIASRHRNGETSAKSGSP
jgi:hypothetical protein